MVRLVNSVACGGDTWGGGGGGVASLGSVVLAVPELIKLMEAWAASVWEGIVVLLLTVVELGVSGLWELDLVVSEVWREYFQWHCQPPCPGEVFSTL